MPNSLQRTLRQLQAWETWHSAERSALYSAGCVEEFFSEVRIEDLARFGLRSLRAAPYLAIQLLQDRLAVLVALLVVANLPELFGRE
jgi:hypothetical protein